MQVSRLNRSGQTASIREAGLEILLGMRNGHAKGIRRVRSWKNFTRAAASVVKPATLLADILSHVGSVIAVTANFITGSAFAVLAYFKPENFSLKSGQLTHYGFTSESGKRWDINFCSKCGTTVYYQLEAWGELIGIDAGTFDPPTFFFDIAGEVFTESKAHFIGDIKADGHFENSPDMSQNVRR